MNGARIEVGDVLGWFKSGLELTFKNPATFLVMGLIFGVIGIALSMIPLLGNIAFTVLIPVLQGGFIYAAREQHHGRTAEIGQLFAAFQQPNKFGPMAILCLPGVAAAILGLIILTVMISSISAIFLGVFIPSVRSIGAFSILDILVVMLLLAAIGLAVLALTFFAVPRVMLDNVEPIAAMKESLAISVENLVGFVSGLIVIGLAFFVVAVIPLLGALAIVLIGTPMSAAAMYFGYRHVFGASDSLQPPLAPPSA